jgi:hypothetical protein
MHERDTSDTPLTALYRSNRHFVVCRACKKRHAFYPTGANHNIYCKSQYDDFCEKHPAHRGCRVYVMTPAQIEALARRTESKKRRHHHSVLNYAHNSDVKEAFQSEQTMTTTNLQSKASSATAGWSGATVDNTSNLYLDADLHVVIAAVNTAPGSDQTIYVFTYAGTNSSDLTPTGAASGGAPGTEGNLTFPSISTLRPCTPTLMQVPYPVQNAAIGGHKNLASVYGLLPAFWGVAVLNFAGFTLAASGNTVKYRGLFCTVI